MINIKDEFINRRDTMLARYNERLNKYFDLHGENIDALFKTLESNNIHVIGPATTGNWYDPINCLDISMLKLVNICRVEDLNKDIKIICTCNFNISKKFKLPYVSLSKLYINGDENTLNKKSKEYKQMVYDANKFINYIVNKNRSDYLPSEQIFANTDINLIKSWKHCIDIACDLPKYIPNIEHYKSDLQTALDIHNQNVHVNKVLDKI